MTSARSVLTRPIFVAERRQPRTVTVVRCVTLRMHPPLAILKAQDRSWVARGDGHVARTSRRDALLGVSLSGQAQRCSRNPCGCFRYRFERIGRCKTKHGITVGLRPCPDRHPPGDRWGRRCCRCQRPEGRDTYSRAAQYHRDFGRPATTRTRCCAAPHARRLGSVDGQPGVGPTAVPSCSSSARLLPLTPVAKRQTRCGLHSAHPEKANRR